MAPHAALALVAALALAACEEASQASVAEEAPARAATKAVESAAPAPSETAAPAPPPPRFEELPWSEVGTGVVVKDSGDPQARNVFVGYAGYRVSIEDAEAWVGALWGAWLRDRGVRWVFAVRGPDDSHYEHKEIGNTKIAARLREIAPAASFVLVAAHSSGSVVAHELFAQLATAKHDPEGVTAGKVVYFNLDGIEKGLEPESVARLRRAYFVGAVDRATDTASPNDRDMRRLGARFAAFGEYLEHDAHPAGCNDDANWCLHVTLVNKRPHDPRAARGHLDYTDFAAGGVETSFFEAKAEEAGLVP